MRDATRNRPRLPGVPESVDRLAQVLGQLPGVGEKTAQRHALAIATRDLGPRGLAGGLEAALALVRAAIRPCERCGNLAEVDDGPGPTWCTICQDVKRDAGLLCIVGRVSDLIALEASAVHRGTYFVLGTLLSPLEGVDASDLPLGALRERVKDAVTEVVLALPSSVDGEATALMLGREFQGRGVRVTRLASGMPHGGEVEYADPATLMRAFSDRRAV